MTSQKILGHQEPSFGILYKQSIENEVLCRLNQGFRPAIEIFPSLYWKRVVVNYGESEFRLVSQALSEGQRLALGDELIKNTP